jgi:hypothetical protein
MSQTRKNKNKQNKTKKRVFAKNDFISGDGFLVSVWGPLQWTFLHIMSFNYPVNPTPEDKKHYMDYVLNLQYVLPCKYCRINLTNNFKKKSNLSYCDVRERYEHFRSRCTEEKPKIFTFKNSKAKTKSNSKSKKEKGCTEPLYGKKSKCVINIVPQEVKTDTFKVDEKCIKTRG